MALVTRYFSTTSAGAADGTSWANRAALFTAGAWSSVILNFDFSAGPLLCLIGPGTYAWGASLAAIDFAVASPTAAFPLFLHGCDSSGNPLTPANPDWTYVEPVDWDSGLPVIASTGDFSVSVIVHYRLAKITSSGRNGSMITGDGTMDWGVVQNSTANISANAVSSSSLIVTNSALSCTGSSYLSVWLPASGSRNVRVQGVTGSSGNRDGIATNLGLIGSNVCSFGNGGRGMAYTGTSASVQFRVHNAVCVDNGGDGVTFPNTASQTNRQVFDRLIATGNGGKGINGGGTNTHVMLTNSRLRDNAGGDMNFDTNFLTTLDNYTTDSDDATEYVDGDNATLSLRDYRIKSSASAVVGRGYTEQAAAAGGGGRVLGSSIIQGIR